MIEIKEPTEEEVNIIIFDDEIYNRIADDRCPVKEDFKFSYKDYDFMGFYLNDKIIGLANVKECGLFHFQVLKPYRRYAREALERYLEKMNRLLYCEIPLCYMSVINFAKNNGFKEEGIINDKKFIKSNIGYNYIKLILKKNEFCNRYS